MHLSRLFVIFLTSLLLAPVCLAQVAPQIVLRDSVTTSNATINVDTPSSGNPSARMELELLINGVKSSHQLPTKMGEGITPAGHAFSWPIIHGGDACTATYYHAINGADHVEIRRNGTLLLTIP